jgi:hypothetical protein
MATSIVPDNIADWMEHDICQKYIRANSIKYSLGDLNISFLPESAINTLAIRSNIKAMVIRDPDLQQLAHFPDDSEEFLAARIFKESKKIFVAAEPEGLSMGFLNVLMRGGKVADEHLPLSDNTTPSDDKDKIWPIADTRKFLEAQKLVCAPVFTIGVGDPAQTVKFPSSTPIVSASLRADDDADGEMYDVEFHPEHLKHQHSAPDVGIGDRKFVTKVFKDLTLTKPTRNVQKFHESEFGSASEFKYYMVFRP